MSKRHSHGQWRLLELEDRLAPAGLIMSLSPADPGASVFTSSGDSQLTRNVDRWPQLISDDGRYSVFLSTANNLVAGQVDRNSRADVFLYDRVLGSAILVSHVPGKFFKLAMVPAPIQLSAIMGGPLYTVPTRQILSTGLPLARQQSYEMSTCTID